VQVRHDEGVAIRIDPEPCAVVRKGDSEAAATASAEVSVSAPQPIAVATSAPAEPVGERRHVTVMFCDLVDSAALLHGSTLRTFLQNRAEQRCCRCFLGLPAFRSGSSCGGERYYPVVMLGLSLPAKQFTLEMQPAKQSTLEM